MTKEYMAYEIRGTYVLRKNKSNENVRLCFVSWPFVVPKLLRNYTFTPRYEDSLRPQDVIIIIDNNNC